MVDTDDVVDGGEGSGWPHIKLEPDEIVGEEEGPLSDDEDRRDDDDGVFCDDDALFFLCG